MFACQKIVDAMELNDSLCLRNLSDALKSQPVDIIDQLRVLPGCLSQSYTLFPPPLSVIRRSATFPPEGRPLGVPDSSCRHEVVYRDPNPAATARLTMQSGAFVGQFLGHCWSLIGLGGK